MPRAKKPAPKTHARDWGEGTVRQVRPGVWRAWRARAKNLGAEKPTRPSRTFAGAGAEQRAKVWARGDVEPDVLLLGHWLDRWLDLRLPLIRPQTTRNYRTFVLLCAPLAGRQLAELTTEDWQRLTNDLLAIRARSSVNAWRAIISSALKAAVPQHLAFNPMTGVKLPKADQRPVKAWKRDEVHALLDAAKGRAHELWLWVSLATGIRLGEARALLWTDVDLAARTIIISKALDHQTDAEGPTKSGKTRIIDLPDELVPILREHRMRQRPGTRHVCASGFSGRVPDPKTIELWLGRLLADLGISKLPPHSTRHTFATLSLDAGVPLKEVSEALGHANVAITANTYSHAVEQRRRRAANAIGAVLTGNDPAALGEDGTPIGTRKHG